MFPSRPCLGHDILQGFPDSASRCVRDDTAKSFICLLDRAPVSSHESWVLADTEFGRGYGERVPGYEGVFDPAPVERARVVAHFLVLDKDVNGEFEETVAADAGRGRSRVLLKRAQDDKLHARVDAFGGLSGEPVEGDGVGVGVLQKSGCRVLEVENQLLARVDGFRDW